MCYLALSTPIRPSFLSRPVFSTRGEICHNIEGFLENGAFSRRGTLLVLTAKRKKKKGGGVQRGGKRRWKRAQEKIGIYHFGGNPAIFIIHLEPRTANGLGLLLLKSLLPIDLDSYLSIHPSFHVLSLQYLLPSCHLYLPGLSFLLLPLCRISSALIPIPHRDTHRSNCPLNPPHQPPHPIPTTQS